MLPQLARHKYLNDTQSHLKIIMRQGRIELYKKGKLNIMILTEKGFNGERVESY